MVDERARLVGVVRRRLDREEAVALDVDPHALAGREPHAPARRDDDARVLDAPADQHGIAAAADLDRTRVADRGGGAVALEDHPTTVEIVVANAQRRRGEALGGDPPRRRYVDAIRIDEVDPPVGRQRSGDVGPGVAGDAIQDGCVGARLPDVDRAALSNREALPVDDSALGVLRDRKRAVRRWPDDGRAGSYRSACRQNLGHGRPRQQRQRRHQRQTRGAAEQQGPKSPRRSAPCRIARNEVHLQFQPQRRSASRMVMGVEIAHAARPSPRPNLARLRQRHSMVTVT